MASDCTSSDGRDTPDLTVSHRLVLPGDANHYGTLYAGSLLRIALEAAYMTAYRRVGREANLVLHRVMDLVCHQPVPVGTVIEIHGAVLHCVRTALVIGLIGASLKPGRGSWMEGLMTFVQIDEHGRPAPLADGPALVLPSGQEWQSLHHRLHLLMRIR